MDLEHVSPCCLLLLNLTVDEPWVKDDTEVVDGPGLNIEKFSFVGVRRLPLPGNVLSTMRPTELDWELEFWVVFWWGRDVDRAAWLLPLQNKSVVGLEG
jgi:hypothetical protein